MSKLGFDSDTAQWLASGTVMLVFGAIAWAKSRPQSLLNRAQAVMPKDTKLDVIVPPSADADVGQLARIDAATNENVSVKLAA